MRTPTKPGTPCGTCATPMLIGHLAGTRGAWHHARGLCHNCYQRSMRWRYVRPLREVDVIAVERAIRGDPPATLTPRERREAIAALTRYGRSAAEISRQLAITPRTVIRHRAALRVAA